MNLFFLAVILSPGSSQTSVSTFWSVVDVTTQVLLVAVYFITLSSAPSMNDMGAVIPAVLLTRLLLLCPYLFLCPKRARPSNSTAISSERSGKLHGDRSLWQAHKPLGWMGVVGYLALQFQHIMTGSSAALPFSQEVIRAINNDSAVSALGYDFALGVISLAAWYTTRWSGKVHVS